MRHAVLAAALAAITSGCFAVQESTTSVRGQVLYGPAALSGALVRLVQQGSAGPTGSSNDQQMLTADNGEYRFDDVPPGDYGIFVTTDRWTAESSVSLQTTVGTPSAKSVTHPLVANDLQDTVQFTPAGGLTGQLTQTGATPVAAPSFEGVLVSLDGTALQARAAADGSFDFGRLPAGDYRVIAVGADVVSDAPVAVSVKAEAMSQVTLDVHATPTPVMKANTPPTVSDISVAPLPASTNPLSLRDVSRLQAAQVMRGDRARLHCMANDPDGDPLTFSWSFSGGTSTPVTMNQDTIDWTAPAGTASIRCIVSDGQGGAATASRTLDVVDYRLSGAALSPARALFAQNDGDGFDLAFYDLQTAAVTRLGAPGDQIGPRVLNNTVVYASDALGTAANPYDVFARILPLGGEVRVSASDGSEVYDIGPAGIAVADNSATCKVSLRVTPAAAASVVFPSLLGGPAPGAVCDRLIVGQTTIILREATAQKQTWRLVNMFSGVITDAPMQWSNDASVAITYNGAAYLAAVPSLQQVFRFTEVSPFVGAVSVGALPALSGTPVASVIGAGVLSAWTAFDTTGLFGSVRGIRSTGPFEISASGARAVLGGASDRWLLVGVPENLESPPGKELLLYDLEQL